MTDTLNEQVGVLTRREIEARALKPFFEAVAAELGEDKTRALLREVVVTAAKDAGAAMRTRAEGDGLEAFAAQWEPWFRGGALEIDELERTEEVWAFNVTRCRYAELYRALGMADLGATLSCNRDAALIEGYSDEVAFERTQTLMAGSGYCDFRYRKK
ncbi:L-2-amino-thiazoline-4-carboxylic acid hydrolase [soil metagenome]